MKTGIASLPLHRGKAPAWLFNRMKKLAREIIYILLWEHGHTHFLKQISNPFWFQALGCVLGFDWHSSGVTTTVCGAIKGGIKGLEKELGIFVAGGKGKYALLTPTEIRSYCEGIDTSPEVLIYASRMTAKVDSAALQDGYNLYHHCIIFTKDKKWAVVQQGMNESTRYARRYHWLCDDITSFVDEPHAAICCNVKNTVFNMTAKESSKTRQGSINIIREPPNLILKEIKKAKHLIMPPSEKIPSEKILTKRFQHILNIIHDKNPIDYAELLSLKGVGPKTVLSLGLISHLLYGSEISTKDPAKFSFAHGGKDGHPFPVNKSLYDNSIKYLHKAVYDAKIGQREKLNALKKLEKLIKINDN